MAVSFLPTAENLPDTLPVLPLAGALLLPRGRLPLNIFEPRYLALVEDALGAGRMIGMVQPLEGAGGAESDLPPLYTVGCAGRIVSLNETEDGRFLFVLQGVCRFAVREEAKSNVITLRGYRSIAPDWQPFLDDLGDNEEQLDRDLRDQLIGAVKPYFKSYNIVANWDTIEECSAEKLVSTLAAVCPFADNEKQALLETPTLEARAQLLVALMHMARRQSPDLELVRH